MEMVDISCCIYSLLGAVPVTCVPVGFLSTRGDEWCCFRPHFSDKETEVQRSKGLFPAVPKPASGSSRHQNPTISPTHPSADLPHPCYWPSGAAAACQPPTGFIFSVSQWVLRENTNVCSQCRKQENVVRAWRRGSEREQHQTEEGWEETWPQVHRRPNDLRESCTISAAMKGES